MKLQAVITASIVVYNEDKDTLQKTITSFLQTPLPKKLFLIDNSTSNSLKKLASHPDVEYIFNNANLGFGKAHNLILKSIENQSDYHLILNPDVTFSEFVIKKLIEVLSKDSNTTMIVPKVVYPDGNVQHIYRKFPTFFDLVIRRLQAFKTRIALQEYQNLDLSKTFYPEAVHGCFMLFKTEDFIKINGFDERYFLYMEDIDICKKIQHSQKKILYYPDEKIVHIHRKGSAKNIKLLWYHLSSAIKYFLKWSAK